MKQIFKPGDVKVYERIVEENDLATFESGNVHPVCATFALARDIEWASRLFVLEMKENDEEGIGTMLAIEHKSPAFPGERIRIQAVVSTLEKNELICNYTVNVGERLIAVGQTGQKVLKKEKIMKVFNSYR
jgi:fluoroacetyl-CoA thioesterase